MKSNEHQIGRREFLFVSSTCAVVAATVGPKLLAATVNAPLQRLAVGYASLDEASGVVAASAIPAGDGAFIGRSARITVSGSSGHSAAASERRGVELLTHFSYMEGAERRETPFHAWGCSRLTGAQGSPVSFNVPVDEVQQIRLSVGVERGPVEKGPASRREAFVARESAESQRLPLTLSLSDSDSLKLVRGYYVIVPLFENERGEPRWSDWRLSRIDGRMALVDSGESIAPFEHLVLRIDYAS